jgi:alkylglycerol monooxygenase
VGPNYIALAIPFFFVLIAVELVLARGRGRRVYRFADAMTDLSCGVTQRVALLFFEALLFALYAWVYSHGRLVDLAPHPVLAWAVALLAVDFTYYWWHRASHRVSFLWVGHVVHHQSEDYNLAVALRQAVLSPVTILPFSLPLALVGVPPLIYLLASAVSTLYQFWIHTELVGRVGLLEAVLNTPSHHRVHHARNPRYLDKNYGAILIIWDRLFGTYQPEREPPVYGVTKPFRSFNPLWAQLQPLAELAARGRGAPGWRARLAAWTAPPDRSFAWRDHDLVSPASTAEKYDVPVSRALRTYVVGNFALLVAATFSLMMWSSSLTTPLLAGGAALVLLTTLTIGGLMEAKRWARPLELARVAVAAVALVWFTGR